MLFKSCPAKVKAAGEGDGLEDGQFEAIVSVFGNVDSYGDMVVKGAFEDTLAEWEKRGDPIPVYYSHRMDDPDYNIGTVLEAKETDAGLWVKGQLRLEATTSKAPQVHRMLMDRSLTQFSFAYDIDEAGAVTKDDEDYFELRRLTLYEVGPTPIGANQETELLGVKHAAEQAVRIARAVKHGRMDLSTLRQAKASLDAAGAQLTDVLAALAGEAGNDTGPPDPVKAEHRTAVKAEELRPTPAELSALLSIELADAG